MYICAFIHVGVCVYMLCVIRTCNIHTVIFTRLCEDSKPYIVLVLSTLLY